MKDENLNNLYEDINESVGFQNMKKVVATTTV